MAVLSAVAGAAITCMAGGILPWINAELVVVGTSLLLPTEAVVLLVVCCAAAQVASKSVIYGLARWAPHRLPRRAVGLLRRAEAYRDRRGTLAALTLSGAVIALPPLYIVTLACGLVRVRFGVFVLAALAGTILRYAILVWVVGALRTG